MRVLFLIHDLLTVPLGVAYISSIVKRAGHETMTAVLTEPDLHRTAEEFSPRVIAFGSTSGFYRTYLRVMGELKEKLDFVSVMGGSHPTFFPEVLEGEPALDYIIRGESEQAFPQLLEAIAGEREIAEVGNLLYREDGRVIANSLLPLLEDLDSIPYPDRNMLARYGVKNNNRTAFFITGRGCPFDCSYCFNHAYRDLYRGLGKARRRRSVDNVIGEITECMADNDRLEMVIFQDDIFILDPDWVFEFCREYPGRVGLPFHCHIRANLVTPEIARALASAGCVSIKMAIETANPRLREEVLNRNMSTETLVAAFDALKEAGIVVVSQNILGIPTSSLQDDLDTLELNVRCAPDFAFATLMQPYPGTRINRFSVEQGMLGSVDKDEAIPDSFFDSSILEIPDRAKRNRLRKLFALAVEFPAIRDSLDTLLDLPLDPLYDIMDKVWKGYCIKHREFPYSTSLREYVNGVRSFFSSKYY